MLPREGWHVHDAVPADDITTPKIATGQGQAYFGPAGNIIKPVCHLKGKVPDDTVIGLHAFVCVLAYAGDVP